MPYLYKTLDEIKQIVSEKTKVTVMGERRWSADRARRVHASLDAESPEASKAGAAGFFRMDYNDQVDLSDAGRLIFFANAWQLSCVFDDEQERYAVYENTGGGSEKAYKTIKLEEKRFAFAKRLGVLTNLPAMEKLVVQEDDATWRMQS